MIPEEAYYKCEKENRRIPELEDLIATDPEYSYHYSFYIIKGRFKQGEETISKYPEWSYRYSFNIIKGPWELGEKNISKDPLYSYVYIYEVIKRPFEKCHPIIFNSEYKDEYLNFLKSINYDLNKISEWLI
jgi:hypothetical protein